MCHFGNYEGVFLIGDRVGERLGDRTLGGDFDTFKAKLRNFNSLLSTLEDDLFRFFGQVVFLVHLLELFELFGSILQCCTSLLYLEFRGGNLTISVDRHKVFMPLPGLPDGAVRLASLDLLVCDGLFVRELGCL